AAAVFLDAFVLRTVLVPSVMHVFGRANWWLPRPVDRRMPHLAVEPTADSTAEYALAGAEAEERQAS
ncbi:MAG TPA: hypothetical protein VK576_08130, partial [Thermoleophilia bacterium]|nr:hypothetical protein [Thermoleophilia bacterium]